MVKPTDTRVEVKRCHLSSAELERNHCVFRVKVYNGNSLWQEEYKTGDEVRAFLRGVKAYASMRGEFIEVPEADGWT